MLRIVSRDAPVDADVADAPRAAAAAANAVRAASHLLALAARCESGRPLLREALARHEPAADAPDGDESSLLHRLAALENSAKARREALRRRRKRLGERCPGIRRSARDDARAAADADRAAAELLRAGGRAERSCPFVLILQRTSRGRRPLQT